jgi:hypothetical protein
MDRTIGTAARLATPPRRGHPPRRVQGGERSACLPTDDDLANTVVVYFHLFRLENIQASRESRTEVDFQLIRMENLPWDADEVQSFSGQLFGSRHRLGVALAIIMVSSAEPYNLYKQALAEKLDVKDPEVEKHLRTFRELGVLERHPDPPPPPTTRGRGRPPTILQPTDDQFWTCLEDLGRRFRRRPPDSTSR